MSTGMESCPFCGNTIMKGAMRCPGCGKILKTAEEQEASYRRLKESQKKSSLVTVLTYLAVIGALAAVGVRYQKEILEFIEGVLGK
ncbi:MAG: hypothetical protein V3W31_09025 [Thermodesulfobacteriota bacterium]